MRRNSGSIGARRTTSRTQGASGIHDTFDQYNSRKNNSWPLVKKFLSISPSANVSYNEGTAFTVSVSTEGFEASDTLYYTISTVNGLIGSLDFTDGLTNGSFSLINNAGSFNKTLVLDGTSETDVFFFEIRTGSINGPIGIRSGNITINNPTFSVSPNVTIANEGSIVLFNVTTSNINSATTLYYNLAGVGITTGDFSPSANTGSFVIGGNSGSFTANILNDVTTEGNETVTVNIRLDSVTGTVVASNSDLVILDTSVAPTANITVNSNPINEGTTLVANVTTTNFTSGTLYWTIEKNTGNVYLSDISNFAGSFTVTSSSGSFTTNIINDGSTESSETFNIRIRLNSLSGSVIGSLTNISITDTSTGNVETANIGTFFNNMCNYLDDYMSEYRNPNFYSYALDGSSTFISDGGGDMYDSGNYTYPWFVGGSPNNSTLSAAGTGTLLDYANSTTPVQIDGDFIYRSLGYSTAQLPLTILGYRANVNTVVGLQKSGNSGADGGGALASGLFYNGATVNGFTVYAFYRETYNTGDPSHCDLYMLIGHPLWGSSFGTIETYADPVSNGGNGGRLNTSTGSTNVIAVTMLLSKSSGILVTQAECETVVQNFTSRMRTFLGI